MRKLLALVLALVMTLGLATIGTNAAFSDADDINYKEAVDVMSALGVLEGTDGAYNPAGILTREQAAKIITYMIIGKTSGDALTSGKAPFTDVAADRWSAGSIDYCTNLGVIAGKGNGTFGPTDELTGYAFAKMLLVALGYDPSIEGLVGSDWKINTAKLALDTKLTADMGGLNFASPITREQAAQMAYNTEKATLVEYNGGIKVGTSDGTTVTANATRSYTGNPAEGFGAGYITNGTANYTQFCERYASNLLLTLGGADDFNRPAESWRNESRNVGTYATKPLATYTGSVKGGTLYTDAGKVSGANATTFNAYWNNVNVGPTGTNAITAANVASGSSTTLPNSGNGTVTELYYNGSTGAMTIVQYDVYLAVANADYNTTSKSLSTTIYYDNGAAGSALKASDWAAVEGAKEKDLFYVTATDSGAGVKTIKSVKAVPSANVVSDVAVSGYRALATVTAGGTTYKLNNVVDTAGIGFGAALLNGGFTLNSGTYDLVLDEYGYVVGAREHTSGTTVNDYVYVTGSVVDALNARASVVFADGSKKTVTVAKVIDSTAVANREYTTGGTFPIGAANDYSAAGAHAAGALSYKAFYKYSVDKSGNYELTWIADGAANAANTQDQFNTSAITAKVATPIAAQAAQVGDSKSVLIANGKVYTGVSNWPAVAASVVNILRDPTNGRILFAYTGTAGTSTATTNDYYFVFGTYDAGTHITATTNKDADGTTYYEYDAIQNGELIKLKATSASGNVIPFGLYEVNSYSDGYAGLNTAPFSSVVAAGTHTFAAVVGDLLWADNTAAGLAPAAISAANGTLTVSGNAKVLNSNAKFYLVDQYAGNYGANITEISASAASNLAAGTAARYNVFGIATSSNDASISTVIIVRIAA